MKKFLMKYPIILVLLLCLSINSYLVLTEGYQYCHTEYCGTVVSKSESCGRYSSSTFLLVDFGRIGQHSLNVHPTTYSSYNVGDRFCSESKFGILFGREGTAYLPEDPKHKILNNPVFCMIHFIFFIALAGVSFTLLIFGVIKLNNIISHWIFKKTEKH